MKLGELATQLGAELRGNPDLEITGVKGIEEAGPTEITFVANVRYTALARATQAAAVLVAPDFQELSAARLRARNSSHRGHRSHSRRRRRRPRRCIRCRRARRPHRPACDHPASR